MNDIFCGYTPEWYEGAIDEYGDLHGADSPDRCWILTPLDVWVRNPHYNGPDQPHPEDYE